MRAPRDTIVVGGGFFGCQLALALRARGDRVLLLEARPGLLERASYHNQARVHNGYHYPRSVLTALRSRINFTRFVRDYADCIVSGFDMYYAIARTLSKLNAAQFRTFCGRIGAEIEPAPKAVAQLFNPELIEAVFKVREYAFDADRLRRQMEAALTAAGVEVRLRVTAERISSAPDGLRLRTAGPGGSEEISAARVFNCTYSQTNRLVSASGLPLIPLKHELAELALVEVPDELKGLGITVMDGPFFSLMPFPPRGLHTLSHVRYTPHHTWQDGSGPYMNAADYFRRVPRNSNFVPMCKDAERYLPRLRSCRQVDSQWEVKTVLPASEVDDSRPILYRRDHGLAGLTCVLGGKLDNIYDVLAELQPDRSPDEEGSKC